MFRRFLTLALFTSLTVSASFAQTALTPQPSVDRLREHVTYLASDKLDGRRTGTAGANLAAEYIAHEFARYGLRRSIGHDTPGMSILEADSPNRYLQKFPYVAGVALGKNNLLSFSAEGTKHELRVGEDWMPLGFSLNSRIEKVPAVFAGYGITAKDLNYDDYSHANASGKIAIAFAAAPEEDNPHGRFVRYKDPRWRAIAARDAGAKALVLIVRAENFREAHLSRLHFDNSAGDAGLPVIAISRQTAARLLNLPDIQALAELETNLKNRTAATAQSSALRAVSDLSLSTEVVRQDVAASNVIGILDGSDPVLQKEAIVIGAHYDHLGRGGEGSLAPREGDIHYGADDNASGTAGLLELARLFASQRPRRSIVFIAFGGEEEGLLGSDYYVNHPIVPLANTVAMINMDMIGRMKDQRLVIGGVGTASEWRSLIESANLLQSITVTASGRASVPRGQVPLVVASNGRTVVSSDSAKQFQLSLSEDGFGPSDHSSFYKKQIPVLFFWTGTHEDYHKPSDTADKINYEDHSRVVGMVARIVRSLDGGEKRPTFMAAKAPEPARSTGFRVYLGTIPNYADSNDGLLLDGVREGSPAANAGLKAGDRIVKIAGRDIKNVYDYTYALGEMTAGQEYEVEIVRGSEQLKLKLVPAARK